jgi:hypothetical protein
MIPSFELLSRILSPARHFKNRLIISRTDINAFLDSASEKEKNTFCSSQLQFFALDAFMATSGKN